MNIPLKTLTFLSLALICAPVSALELSSWDDLSNRDISPTAKMALSFSEDWQHAESDHFIYHFLSEKSAETITTYAEIYYTWIKTLFGIQEDKWESKAQIFIFEDETNWKDFIRKSNASLETPAAYTDGRELFIYRTPFWLSPRQTLAHEVTHILAYRFLDGPIPIFLNEGFAEYVSYKTLATHFGGDEHRLRMGGRIADEDYIPLAELAEFKSYPEERVKTFYKESEYLVRFLVQRKSGSDFYEFLKTISQGSTFEGALEKVYGVSLETLEEDFLSYISKL